MNENRKSKISLQTIAFAYGFATMAMEISAARLFAPYFGTSALVWTNVIGVVLVTLSLGYWLGGKLAQTKQDTYTLVKISTLAAIYTALVAATGHNLLALLEKLLMAQGISYIMTGSLVGALALFGPPIFLAGLASPYLISLGVKSTNKLGDTVGSFYAISTIGGLLGTFLPTLLLVPTIGTTKTIYLCSVLFAFAGLIAFPKRASGAYLLGGIVLLSIFVNPSPKPYKNNNEEILAATESTYQYIQITETTSGRRFLKFDSGLGVQSVYDKGNFLSGLYYDAYSVFPALLEKSKINVLILGFAGGTIAKQLNHFYPEKMDITGIELDPKVLALSKEYLNVQPEDYVLKQEDARLAVHNSKEKFDLIIIDAYHNEIQIPWQMTTQEFWREVSNTLSEDGIVLMNIVHLNNPSFFTASIANTLSTVFTNTYSAKPSPKSHNNTILIATNNHLDLEKASPPLELSESLQTINSTLKKVFYSQDLPTLKDDNTSIEWLLLKDISS